MSVFLLHPPTFRSYLVSAGYLKTAALNYLVNYARARVYDTLREGIVKGTLAIVDEDGTTEFGDPDSNGISVTLTVNSPNMWTRVMMSNDLGVSEAYMESDFDVSSLKDLLNLWLDNRHTLTGMHNTVNSLFTYYSALAIKTLGRQNLSNAKWNAEVAYNTSNKFFQSFLSKEMMYSCAIWGDEEGGPRGDLVSGPTPGDLEAAQHRKIMNILGKARLRPGDRLLEIGTGWGAMAINAALMGCTVDTVTLCKEQMAMTQQRAREAGVEDRVRVHLCDYRQLPASFEKQFDAMITCEMIEAVGPRYLPEFFQIMDWALKDDRATMVITATSQPDSRYTDYQPDDFARHYHWPNCHLPSSTSMAVWVQKAVPGKFVFHHLEDHGPHYCRTLREWGRRLEKNFNGEVIQELRERYPQLQTEHDIEAFKRKWMYMFVYAEVGYARAYTSLYCWTFTRTDNVAMVCS
ncbi:cyclopropane fatty acid synthase [Punctularia strigosozonata HHB-11173 SS5]|uniref:cyclopropane fatty acid synthase n=1 Tax=Punctularia strigosozonata (strain HHB-11173) TaxID=741275 RepID=UPI0004417984|nr:cyclopropane fatty acid synthase [Punctularia strigosozonata HHB-11173 SS5]EIN09175.1 cyclopropane fatty acid synthase [Punctularia strigosozonata HHB-11173 SS5]